MQPFGRVFGSCAVAAVALALTGAACSGSRQTAAPVLDVPSVPLAIKGASNAGASVVADGKHVVVTWAATAEGQTNVYAATSDDGAVTFASPVRVNDIDGDARISGEQAPRAALGHDVVVAWISKLAGSSRVRLARSTDGGRTFRPATTPHAENLSGARGWTSVTIDRDQAVHAVWLDGRDAHAGAAASAGHEHAMRQDIYQVILRPNGARRESRVATDVCFCCKTAVAASNEGATYVAWRHVYPTNLRDIAVARSTDGGGTFTPPVRVSEDHWELDGCPEDGPAIAVTPGGVVHVVWPTLIQGTADRKGIFYSSSSDGGQTFAPRTRLDRDDDGSTIAAHPQITVTKSGLSVTWDESTGKGHRIRVKQLVLQPDRRSWQPISAAALTVNSGDEPASYPAIAYTPDGVVVAWTVNGSSGSEIRVRPIRW